MTGFSTAPLQLASLIGFGCTHLGIAVFVYVVGCYLLEGSMPGFPFLAVNHRHLFRRPAFRLGVIGEYLARIHFRTMNRPVYFVRSVTGERKTSNDRAMIVRLDPAATDDLKEALPRFAHKPLSHLVLFKA